MSHHAIEKQLGKSSAMRQIAVSPCLQPGKSSSVAAVNQCRPNGILVIEDEHLLRRLLEKGLRKKGFAVWVAADGSEGVDLYRRVEAQIDVVLSDVQMPVLDGPKTLDALRKINPSVRCCFMTGDTTPTLLAHLMGQRPDGLFIKPFGVTEVAAVLREVASQSPSGNVEMIGNSTGGDNPESSDTQGMLNGDDVRSESHSRPVPPLLRTFAALIELGEEWSGGRK